MKKKTLIAFILFLLCMFGLVTGKYLLTPAGRTIESREKLLGNTPSGTAWKIATEQQIEDYIISGIYSDDGKVGIAVFKPDGKYRYKQQSKKWRGSSDVIIDGVIINDTWYDLIWFNEVQTDYAEITYKIKGHDDEVIRHEADNQEIFYHTVEAKEYSIEVIYYDKEGNKFE